MEGGKHKFIISNVQQPLKAGHERPVIIHRAILGSVERFMAILTEHLAGKWPLWLSPRQVVVCSISEKYLGYARKVYEELKDQGFAVEIDDSDASISKKIRNGQLAQFNYILILGEQEESTNTVEIRSREGGEKMVTPYILSNSCRGKWRSKTLQKISNLNIQQEFLFHKSLLMKND